MQHAPARLNTSAAIGTVLLTGLLMMATQALGQYFAIPLHSVCTMPAGDESKHIEMLQCSSSAKEKGRRHETVLCNALTQHLHISSKKPSASVLTASAASTSRSAERHPIVAGEERHVSRHFLNPPPAPEHQHAWHLWTCSRCTQVVKNTRGACCQVQAGGVLPPPPLLKSMATPDSPRGFDRDRQMHTSIGVEQVVSAHARLAGDARRDHSQVCPIKRSPKLL